MADERLQKRLKEELNSFKGIWKGGYYDGDPLDPMGRMSGGVFLGYMSVLHVVYLACIKPYVKPDSIVLEIGPGRGAWTKTFLGAKEVWCLDALPAEYNRFWEYVGRQDHIKYIQVSDFSCSALPDDHFTYFFSSGVFCHISFDGITEYMKNLYTKLKKGCHCFIMIADYDKYNRAKKDVQRTNPFRIMEKKGIFSVVPKLACWVKSFYKKYQFLDPNEDDVPRPGRWYNAGTERTCKMLANLGYKVIDPDMGVLHRDPFIHFMKP